MSDDEDATVEIPKELQDRPDAPVRVYKYYPLQFSIENKFRLPQDLTMSMIRRTGNEGIGRVQVGKAMGIDTSTKGGNRKVSAHIQAVSYSYQKHIGQFQKMEGRQRSIKYFWKPSSAPDQFKKFFTEYEALTGTKCPFKLQQVIKFEGHKLNTLRISDVTMGRLNLILRLCEERKVIVSTHKLTRLIDDHSKANGYNYSIDKRSLNKCTLALQFQRAINIYDTIVRVEHCDHTVTLYCHRDVAADDEIISKAVSDILEEFNKAGKIFPHGQLKTLKREPAEEEEAATADENGDLEPLVNFDASSMSVYQRYQCIKIQSTRVLANPTFHVTKAVASNHEVAPAAKADLDDTITESMDTSDVPETSPEKVLANLTTVASMFTGTEKREHLKEKIPWLTEYEADPTAFGLQSKGIRLLMLHHVAWTFVFGQTDVEGVHAFTHHPPDKPVINWVTRSVDQLEVFREQPEFLRFVPPAPQFGDKEKGWFVVQDLIMVMPVIVYVTIVYIPKRANLGELYDILTDPVRKYTPVGDLEPLMREVFMTDKRGWKQIEYHMLLLCVIGLAYQGINPNSRRFPTANMTMFCIAKKSILRDTSSSKPGYTEVTKPMSQYQQYVYEFDTMTDVSTYWHHLRAIVISTPLQYRSELNNEPRANMRTKAYGAGNFDKSLITKETVNQDDICLPMQPHLGCAGFDCALFIHLKRHWELNAIPTTFSNWLIHWFSADIERFKRTIETRVVNLHLDWNNFIKWNVTETEKRKYRLKPDVNPTPRRNHLDEKNKKISLSRKRKVEEPPLGRHGPNRLRARFSSEEKDGLILIRAVGFFLNPVYRFWLDPTVIKDLMYDHVPSSRNKTIPCLLAAGTRELVRGQRLAYLQRIVKSLSTLPQMRKLRQQLATNPPGSSQAKQSFFKAAFKTAVSLLKSESDPVPKCATSDAEFIKQIKEDGKILKAEVFQKLAKTHREPPQSVYDIQRALAATLVVAVLTQKSERTLSGIVLDKFDARVVYDAIHRLKGDGLVTPSKANDTMRSKSQIILSHYFRNFFTHRFDIDVIEGLWEINDDIEANNGSQLLLEGDMKANIIALGATFYDNSIEVGLNIDETILDVFTVPEEASHMKQVRYLESINLQLEKITVSINKTAIPNDLDEQPLTFLERSHAKKPTCSFKDFVQNSELNKKGKVAVKEVYALIEKAGFLGISIESITEQSKLTTDTVRDVLDILTDLAFIAEVGCDQRRWVVEAHLQHWTVHGETAERFAPRPWVLANGALCPPIVRWIAEGVLMFTVARPGVQVNYVTNHFESVVLPAHILDIIDFLEKNKCVVMQEDEYRSNILSSPFDEAGPKIFVRTIHPTVDAFDRFSAMFKGVTLLQTMLTDTY